MRRREKRRIWPCGWTDLESSMRNEKKKQEGNMKYVCKICGWVYDPAEHDNVAFEDLPDDWRCPICGVGKEDFEPA